MEVCKCCYKCKDRVIGCHSKCNRYKEWRIQKDKELQEIRRQKDLESQIQGYKSKRHK